MDSITQNKRYLPHENSTKINSVKLYRITKDIGLVFCRYRISKASLMRGINGMLFSVIFKYTFDTHLTHLLYIFYRFLRILADVFQEGSENKKSLQSLRT